MKVKKGGKSQMVIDLNANVLAEAGWLAGWRATTVGKDINLRIRCS